MFSQDESVPLKFLDEFDADLYSEECVGDKGHNPLHFAARCDYAQATRVILSKGYIKLLWLHDTNSLYPVQIALEKQYWGTAAVMLKAMADWSVHVNHLVYYCHVSMVTDHLTPGISPQVILKMLHILITHHSTSSP